LARPADSWRSSLTRNFECSQCADTEVDGKPLLTPDELPILHKAVLAQCDAADALISDPWACQPKLNPVLSNPGQDEPLARPSPQVHAAAEIYRGAHDGGRAASWSSAPLPGSELAWTGMNVPFPGQEQAMNAMMSTGTLQNLLFDPNPIALDFVDVDLTASGCASWFRKRIRPIAAGATRRRRAGPCSLQSLATGSEARAWPPEVLH
jgi:hypothetical protein